VQFSRLGDPYPTEGRICRRATASAPRAFVVVLTPPPPRSREASTESVGTESLSITDKIIQVYSPTGEFVDFVEVSSYSDYGDALNKAITLLNVGSKAYPGTIVLPATDGKQDFSTQVTYGERTIFTGQGGMTANSGFDSPATHLNYTGTGPAFKDQRQSAATRGVAFERMRIDVSNSGGTLLNSYQGNDFRLVEFVSFGPNDTGSVAFDLHSDNTRAQDWVFDHVSLFDYDTTFDCTDDSNSDNPVTRFDLRQIVIGSSVNGATAVNGVAQQWTFLGGEINYAGTANTTGLNVSAGAHVLANLRIEQTGLAVDLTGLATDAKACTILGGTYNPGGSQSTQFNDPNGRLNILGAEGPDDRLVDGQAFLGGLSISDFDGNGNSQLIELESVGNDTQVWQNRGGDLTARNKTASRNDFTIRGGGNIDANTGAVRVLSAGKGVVINNAENLSGKTGNNDGEIRMDDGTNTAARMTPCIWDGTNSVWRPVNDPSTGSFT
jgi:hypothetical protein